MKKILTEKVAQGHANSNVKDFLAGFRINNVHFLLLIAIIAISYASNSFANRPSMDDNEDQDDSHRSSPSSVEMMMMQQDQQTGDVLNLPAQEIQPGETVKIRLLDTPRRGTSMNQVRQTYGEPADASDSVGKPPITSWTYTDRVVYFEYSTVLHVVAR